MGRKRKSTADLVSVMDDSSTDADDAFLVDSDDGDDDIPHTQPVDDRVLKDVIAYVEVRTKTENRSKGVSKQLELLGAKVEKKFTNDVTHIVWKDGKKSTRDKAVKKGIRLVSVLWVDSCKQNQEHVAESLFPVAAPDDKDVLQIGKLKRMKSMQPKEVEEDIQRSAGRGTRKKKARVLHPSPAPLTIINPAILVAETQPMMSPVTDGVPLTPSLIPDTPTALKPCLDLLDSIKKKQGSAHRRLSITNSPNISPSTPLRQRLFQCFTEEVNSFTESPSTSVKLHKSGPVRRPKARKSIGEVEEMEIDTPNAGTEASSRGRRRRSTATPGGTKLANVENVKGGVSPAKVVGSGKRGRRRSSATPRVSISDDVSSGPGDKQENNSSSAGDDKNSKKKGPRKRDISLNRKLSLDSESSSSQETTSKGLKKDSKSGKDESVGTKKKRGSSSKVRTETVSPVADTSGLSETSNITVVSTSSNATGGIQSSLEETSTELTEDGKCVKDGGAARLKRKRAVSSKEIDGSVSAGKRSVCETSEEMMTSTSGTGSSRSSTRRRSCLPSLPIQPSPEDGATDQTRRRSSRRKSVTPLLNQPSLADHLKPFGIKPTMDTAREDRTVGKRKGSIKGTTLAEVHVSLQEEEKDDHHLQKTQKSLSPTGTRSCTDNVQEDRTVGKRKGIIKGTPLLEVSLKEEEVQYPHPKKKKLSLSSAKTRSSMENVQEDRTVQKREGVTKATSLSDVILIEDEDDCHPKKQQKSQSPGELQEITHDKLIEDLGKECKLGEKENHSAEIATPMALGKRIGSTSEEGVRKRKLLSPLPSELASSSVLSSIDVQNRPSIEEFKLEGSTRPKPKKSALKKGAAKVLCTSSEESAASSDDLDDTLKKENESASTATKEKKTKKRKKVTMSESLPTSKKKKSTIVMTSLHRSDQEIVIAVVKDLGQFEVTDTVRETTTHVVIGENRRTLNVLSGIARGCWILSMDWVYRSVEASTWLPEEPYEMNVHFPGAMISRLAHGAKSNTDTSPVDIFSSFDALYVPPESNPPRERLVELIEMCGGQISRKVSEAKLCVGGRSRGKKGSIPVVAERWILDCITRFKLLPWDSYTVNKS